MTALRHSDVDSVTSTSALQGIEREWNYLPFKTITIRLPWSPSVNAAYGNNKGKGRRGRFKTVKAKRFAAEVYSNIYAQRIPRNLLAHPMQITITQHARSGHGDVDNGTKCVLDELVNAGVIADDNRSIVKRVITQDGARSAQPYITVAIECLRD